jgi:hypothetical protein
MVWKILALLYEKNDDVSSYYIEEEVKYLSHL